MLFTHVNYPVPFIGFMVITLTSSLLSFPGSIPQYKLTKNDKGFVPLFNIN